jgi:D-2-hydroxyacid dehydrogenase (NADP+)
MRVNETGSAEPAPLRTVVIAMSVPDEILTRFRAEFPQLRFVVRGEEAGALDYAGIGDTPMEDEVREADGFIGWKFDTRLLSVASNLRWVHAAGAGVESYDLGELAAHGIVLTNSSGVSAPNMAEHVLGMMIALARRFPRLMRVQAQREWRDEATHREIGELLDQTVLVVGIGEVGRAVAQRAAAFGMRVHGLRRRDASAPAGFAKVFATSELYEALAEADHVVITLPDTPQSRGMFDAGALAAMKPGAVIYNVGRGPVIDSAALIAALESGHLGGAGLDVTDPEPLPADSPLWDMENVLITAHTSGATPKYWKRQSELILEIIRSIQAGDPPRNLVDLNAGY